MSTIEKDRPDAKARVVLAMIAASALAVAALIVLLTTVQSPKSAVAPPAAAAADEVFGLITSKYMIGDGHDCREEMSGLQSGFSVRIEDSGGKILGQGTLQASDSNSGGCYLYFKIPGVPVSQDSTEYYTLKSDCVHVGFKGDDRYVSATVNSGCGDYAAG